MKMYRSPSIPSRCYRLSCWRRFPIGSSWKCTMLVLSQRNLLDYLPPLISHDMQSPRTSVLGSLTVECTLPDQYSRPIISSYFFPQLRESSCYLASIQSFHKLLPAGLRRLSLTYCHLLTLLEDCKSLLHDLEQLEELSIRDQPMASIISRQGLLLPLHGTVKLPQLKWLVLWNYSLPDTIPFLR